MELLPFTKINKLFKNNYVHLHRQKAIFAYEKKKNPIPAG